MNTIIEELLHHPFTRYAIHRSMRVIDQHTSSKKWLPQIKSVRQIVRDYYHTRDHYYTINGKKHGPYIKRWFNGNLRSISEYVDDLLHGKRIVYDEYENRIFEYECLYGKLHGVYKEWWGGWNYQQVERKKLEREFKNGEPISTCKRWSFDGGVVK